MNRSEFKKYLKEIIFFKVTRYFVMTMLTSLLINYAGYVVAHFFKLPFWLDTIGTMVAAIEFGPIAGALIGGISTISLTIFRGVPIAYSAVGAMVGIVIGFLFPRNAKGEKLGIVSLAILVGILTTFISVFINIHYNNGYTGNLWGDALYDMLRNTVNAFRFNTFVAEGFVDLPDRVISIFIAVVAVRQKDKMFLKNKRKKYGTKATSMILIMGFIMLLSGSASVKAADFESEYETVSYGVNEGILTAEINAVAQTKEGYIWVGTYAGLYIYDGIKFKEFKPDRRIRNVMTLYVDSKGRLWIGTNDAGVCCYNPENGETQFYSKDNGLMANSIRAIGEDKLGNVYIGTVLQLSKITPDGKIKTFTEWDDIYYVNSFLTMDDGSLVGVTNAGKLFLMRDDMLLSITDYDYEGVHYRQVEASGDEILVGTSEYDIDRYKIENDELKYTGNFSLVGLSYVNKMEYNSEIGGYFICCENGMGFLDDTTEKLVNLSHTGFDGAVSDVCIDNQGNIWFASSKQGLLRYSKTPFNNVFTKAGLNADVVNAVMKDDNKLYIGMDKGLKIINLKTYRQIHKDYLDMLEGVRVRHIMKDSKGNIWLSTYGADGLVCIKPDGNIVNFNDTNGDMLGGRCRLVTELSNGTIVAASNMGLSFIKDGVVVNTLGEEDGLNNQYILTLIEREDGSILAGSDGDGIYIIKSGRVAGHIGDAEGLNTAVILRIVPCTHGYIYVTSNALYYDNGEEIRELKNFPYPNCYDVQITKDKECWITSSAGMFIVDEKTLLEDKEYDCTLLNENWGLTTTFTANSWNITDGDVMYLCCTDSVRRISVNDYDTISGDYTPKLMSVNLDDEIIYEKNGKVEIPASSGRIQFNIAINNFSLSNPMVHYYLEGLNDEGITCYQNEITPLTFTNLPYGNYKLHIEIIDRDTGNIEKHIVTEVTKEAMMYEHLYFKLYLMLIAMLLLMYVGWLFVAIRRKSLSIIGLEKEIETDPMTGLLNKAGSESVLKSTCADETGILMMIDLDSFKLVNDIYGHDMGDRILIRFAELIREAVDEEDIAGRMGGDEFISFIKNTLDEEDVDKITKFLNKEIVKSAKEYMGEDMNIPLGTSIGAVRVPKEGREFSELFKLADKALYVVKQNGKHGYSFYQKKSSSKDDNEDERDNNNLEQIKKITGERNEGKGAYLVNFDKMQVIYKFMNRNDSVNESNTGFIRFVIESMDGEEITDELKDDFEDYLVVSLKKNDVVSRYSGSFFVLCGEYENDKFDNLAERLVSGWMKNEAHKKYNVIYEVELVGE